MKGWRRQNVAKQLTVDMLIEIPAKTIYGFQLVDFTRLYIQFVWQNDKTQDRV